MKAIITTITIILSAICSFAQITFEKGYFIDNNNQRVECLIKNTDWKNNPKAIEFKTEETSEKQEAGISSIREFGINGFSKYLRVKTNIDRSSTDVSSLSTQSNPEWSEEELFLKVLIEGKASLYYFEDNSFRRFFFAVNDTTINQLVYKEYLNAENKIALNNGFRQQLWANVRCSATTINSVEGLPYDKTSLLNYFKKFNECSGETIVEYNKRKKGEFLHVRLVTGINHTTVSIKNVESDLKNTDFKNTIGFRLGLETEVILPFNRNKWGFLFEPTFQYSNSTGTNSLGAATLHLSSIEFPLGVRYNIFLNKNLTLYFNGFLIPGFCADFHSTLDFDYPFASSLKIKNMGSLSLGGGVKAKKINAELRYYSNRDILNNYLRWFSDYQRFSILIGFRLFGKN